jgi:AcrR family transcriptional regulator
MGKHEVQRAALEVRLAEWVLAEGLSKTSLRQLAAGTGTSDRMLLYYFRDKAELLEVVLDRIAGALTLCLTAAVPEGEKFTPAQLYSRVAALAASAELRPYMDRWGEMAAAAARQEQPFAAIADAITRGFQLWVESRLAISDDAQRRDMASLLIVMIDGGALLEPLDGGRVTARARQAMQVLLEST